MSKSKKLRRWPGAMRFCGVLPILAASCVWVCAQDQRAPDAAADAAGFAPFLAALRANPHDPAAMAFFRKTSFGALWPLLEKTDNDAQLRYLLLLRYVNDADPKALAALMQKKGDDVMAVAQATYWRIVAFPLRGDGAYHWATLASTWDAASRTLTNIIRLSIEKQYKSGAMPHFKQYQRYVVSDLGVVEEVGWDGSVRRGRRGLMTSWGYRGDYSWDQIIARHQSQPEMTRFSGWTPNILPDSEADSAAGPPARLSRRWRAAVLSAPDVRKSGLDDLVAVALQNVDNLETLERDAVDAAFKEYDLAAALGSDAGVTRLHIPKLAGADVLVLINVEMRAGSRSLKVAVSECATGALLGLTFLPWPPADVGQCAQEIGRRALAALGRFPNGVERVVGVGRLRCTNLDYTYSHLQTAFARLIQSGLTQREGVAVVDIEEAQALRTEMEQGGRDRTDVRLPVFVQGEFAIDGVAPASQRVNLAVDIMGGANATRRVTKTGILLEDVPAYFATDLPREILAEHATGEDIGIERQFGILTARAEEWDRLAEWRTAAELREAALLIKPDAADVRLRLVQRHKDPTQRRVHLEYLIRHGQIARGQAASLFGSVIPPVAPAPLMFFSEELQRKLRDDREQKLGDLTHVFPLILGLPGAADEVAADAEIETYRNVLLALLSGEDAGMKRQVLEGIASSASVPEQARALARYLLDPNSGEPVADVVSPNTRFVIHWRNPPSGEALQKLRQSDDPMDKFFVWRADMHDAALSPKIRYLAARQAAALFKAHRDWFKCPTDSNTGYQLMRETENTVKELICLVAPSPEVSRPLPLRFPAPGFPAPKPTDRPELVRTPLNFKIRDLSGALVDLRPHRFNPTGIDKPASHRLEYLLNCGAFDVFWSGSALLLHREPGIMIEILAGFTPRLSDVGWDGRFLWLGTVTNGIWVADAMGRVLRKIGPRDGLPGVAEYVRAIDGSRGLFIQPVAPGRIIAVGQIKKDPTLSNSALRTWCAMLDYNVSDVAVKVFHEARRTITDAEAPEDLIADPEMGFSPKWIRYYHDPKTGAGFVYVGRYTHDRLWPARRYPLRIDLATLGVVVDLSPPEFPPPLLPAEYEVVRAVLDKPGADTEPWATSALLGPIAWVPHLGRYTQLSLRAAGTPPPLPLYVVAENGNLDLVRQALAAGVDVDRGDGLSPLNWACLRGHADIVRFLLDAGADVNHTHPHGMLRRPLHHVLAGPPASSRMDIVRMLLARGADINAQDRQGFTPLHWALIMGHEAETAALVAAGVDLTKTDEGGRTPLHLAVWYGRAPAVDALLTKGADATKTDKWQQTPLHYAARAGRIALLPALIECGADVNAPDALGDTPMQKAVWVDDITMVDALRERGADINRADADGLTPLKCALLLGNEQMAAHLRGRGGIE